jgi:hypothetical protein
LEKKNIELNKPKKFEEKKPSSFTDKRQTNARPAPRYKQGKPIKQTYQQITQKQQSEKESGEEQMPLNKFIAHAGLWKTRSS